MTPQLRLACKQAGQKAVGDTACKLLVHAADLEGERLDVPRRLLIVLSASLTTWLDGTAPDGLDPDLVDVAATGIEDTERWASWLRTELSADVLLRDAMANEINSAISAVLDAG